MHEAPPTHCRLWMVILLHDPVLLFNAPSTSTGKSNARSEIREAGFRGQRDVSPVSRGRKDCSVLLLHSTPTDCWLYILLQTRTHGENMAEAAAREVGPARLSTLKGTEGLVDQAASDLDRAVNLLKGYLSEDRLSRMQDVLDERTRSATLVFENPANPNNVRWDGMRQF